jgi:DNA-binding MarR family transcriptional regulator
MASSEKSGDDRQAERRIAARTMKRILLSFRSHLDERLRPQGVTTAQLQLLYTIRNEPGGSGAQLARSCYMKPQSAQALLIHLEDGGWITRSKHRGNDRVLIAELTPSGLELLETSEKVAQTIEKRLWKGISDTKVKELNKTLARCLVNLEGED